MRTTMRVQIMDAADCISDNANTHAKGMKPIILLLAFRK